MRFAVRLFLFMSILAVAVIETAAWFARHPQDLPWTALDLNRPAGRFTTAKLAALANDPAQCRTLLKAAGAPVRSAPDRRGGPECGYDNGVILSGGGGGDPLRFAPAAPVAACQVAAGVHLWRRDVVQPAAERFLGTTVTAIDHAGSYSCRRLYGRASGPWSEHARANAFDVLGFRLADGRTVSVLRDWPRDSAEGRFLREVHAGGCRIFTTVLGPEYNAAHRNHFHLDLAARPGGWSACR
jgi:hypothetical protein